MIFDPTFVAHLERALTPPPAIKQQWMSEAAQSAASAFEAEAKSARQATAAWINGLDELGQEIVVLKDREWGETDLISLRHYIGYVEEFAEKQAKKAARDEKDYMRRIKETKRSDASLAALRAKRLEMYVDLQVQSIKASLDFALLMRSVMSAKSEDSRGGPSFDNPVDLERYLRDATAV